MNFVIVGGNYVNKGAQAMLYRTVYELKRRFPEARIYYATTEAPSNALKCDFVYCESRSMYTMQSFFKTIYAFTVALARHILRGGVKPTRIFDYKRVMKKATAVFDISGYVFTSKASEVDNRFFISNILAARKYGAMHFVLPQSFGPFDNSRTQEMLDRIASDALPYSSVIYAREDSGYQTMIKHFGLKNIQRSPDIVLQGGDIDYSSIIANYSQRSIISEGGVAIVPNEKVFRNYSNGHELYELYTTMIKEIIEGGQQVTILRHSREDSGICRRLKESFPDDDRVKLIDCDIDCDMFSGYVQNKTFVVASRYHALVHSLRAGIPCIAIGWADKYIELMSLFGLQENVFTTENGIDASTVLDRVRYLLCGEVNTEELLLISKELQKQNRFDKIAEMIRTGDTDK